MNMWKNGYTSLTMLLHSTDKKNRQSWDKFTSHFKDLPIPGMKIIKLLWWIWMDSRESSRMLFRVSSKEKEPSSLKDSTSKRVCRRECRRYEPPFSASGPEHYRRKERFTAVSIALVEYHLALRRAHLAKIKLKQIICVLGPRLQNRENLRAVRCHVVLYV